jgi:hypothetical protein
MTIGRSRNLAEQLDAALDGRAKDVPDELASLVALADELRDDVASLELDPAVTEKHLNLVYRRGRTARASRSSRRQQVERTWRRRAVSVAFAAILLLVPASFASGSAMPGDPLYPLKRGLEKVRLVAALSPGADAETRTSIADVRLEELEGLLQAGEFGRVPEALVALQQAVLDAQQAVAAARARGADSTEIAALESRLDSLQRVQAEAVAKALSGLPKATRDSIIKKIEETVTTVGGSGTTATTQSGGGGGPTTTTSCGGRGEPKCIDDVDPTTTTGETTTSAPTTTSPEPTTTAPSDTTTSSDTTGDGRGGGGNTVDSIIDTILP